MNPTQLVSVLSSLQFNTLSDMSVMELHGPGSYTVPELVQNTYHSQKLSSIPMIMWAEVEPELEPTLLGSTASPQENRTAGTCESLQQKREGT